MSVVRTVRPILSALGPRDDIEVLTLAPPLKGSLALWRQTALVREASRSGADVLHSFVSAFPLTSRIRTVQTVHEVPWARGARENAGPVHRTWAALGRRFAAATCTPSQGVADDLEPHPRLHVVPWGVDPAFGPEQDAFDRALRFGHPELPTRPFVLALGATRPKKRLDRVCAGAERAGFAVVATGEVDAGTQALAERYSDLVLVGVIDALVLPALVRASACVAVLSESEGFALPVLEALRSRRAVVTPFGSVQSGTAGGVAFDAHPDDPDDVARAMTEAADADDARRTAGREVAGKHTWWRTAEQLVEVWRSIA
ncbi:MAG: glycosyltransferase [Planctomycetota bacterium]